MLLERSLFERTKNHILKAIDNANAEDNPFPHILIKDVFPDEVYQRLIEGYPSDACFSKANPKHHLDNYGNSTRQRMSLTEDSMKSLPTADHLLWATIRAAISCRETRNAVFSKLAIGLCRRFRIAKEQLSQIPAFPRGQLYTEVEGYRIAPHPDTREKIVTMQFAFPTDDSLKHVGTEFYQRSLNPLHFMREPRGFLISRTMPFLPNHAYAFSVLNDLGLKSWHGRSTIPPMKSVRNTLLHIWYAEADESQRDLDMYWEYLKQQPVAVRRAA